MFVVSQINKLKHSPRRDYLVLLRRTTPCGRFITERIPFPPVRNYSTLPTCENNQGPFLPSAVHSGVKQPSSPKYINPNKATPTFHTLSPTAVSDIKNSYLG
ncbi:hypothetical protein TNCV_825751 [Trichonephila clavipes]|nr:hypothetical protein TNCV_825751 [Trichonephila clavipes]